TELFFQARLCACVYVCGCAAASLRTDTRLRYLTLTHTHACAHGNTHETLTTARARLQIVRTPPSAVLTVWSGGLIGFLVFYIMWITGALLVARSYHNTYLSYYYYR